MTTSNVIAICLLVMAILDTLGARYILPGMFDKQPEMTDVQKKRLLNIVNVGTLLFAGAAVVIYATQVLG